MKPRANKTYPCPDRLLAPSTRIISSGGELEDVGKPRAGRLFCPAGAVLIPAIGPLPDQAGQLWQSGEPKSPEACMSSPQPNAEATEPRRTSGARGPGDAKEAATPSQAALGNAAAHGA